MVLMGFATVHGFRYPLGALERIPHRMGDDCIKCSHHPRKFGKRFSVLGMVHFSRFSLNFPAWGQVNHLCQCPLCQLLDRLSEFTLFAAAMLFE